MTATTKEPKYQIVLLPQPDPKIKDGSQTHADIDGSDLAFETMRAVRALRNGDAACIVISEVSAKNGG